MFMLMLGDLLKGFCQADGSLFCLLSELRNLLCLSLEFAIVMVSRFRLCFCFGLVMMTLG